MRPKFTCFKIIIKNLFGGLAWALARGEKVSCLRGTCTFPRQADVFFSPALRSCHNINELKKNILSFIFLIMNISKEDLFDLLNVSTKGQLFQFNGALYEHTDGVAMGSPVFMSSLEEKLELEGKLPDYYRRYVDDTLTIMPNITTATDFLNTLNHSHPSVSFTMEIKKMACSPFLAPSS